MKPDLAWIAGIYEGEGSVLGNRGQGFRLTVVQKDPWLLLELKAQLGGHIYRTKQSGLGGECMRWELQNRHAVEVALAIRPRLSPRRRAQLDKALAVWAQRLTRSFKPSPRTRLNRKIMRVLKAS
jgi:hypothetical protein